MECNLVAWCSAQAVIGVGCYYFCISVTHAINCVSGLVNWYILSVAVESFVLFKLISVFIRLLVGFGRCSKAVDDKDGRTGKVVDGALSSGNFVIKYQALGYLSLGIVIHSVIVTFLAFLLGELYCSDSDFLAVCVGAGYIIFFLVVLEGDEVFGTGGANRKFVLIDVHFMSDIISTAIFRNLSEEWAIAWNSDCADR